MIIGPIKSAFSWGLVIPGHNGGKWLSQATASTRHELIKEFGAYFEEDWRKGWKRAYRSGYRAIRVQIVPAFGGDR